MTLPITIHHLEGRRCERIVWLMEELGLPYELSFEAGDMMKSIDMLRTVNPGVPMFPTVRYGDQVLVESGAIIELILARHGQGRLQPATDSADFPGYLMWLHYAEGTLASRVFGEYAARRSGTASAAGRLAGGAKRSIRFAEDHLAAHPWFGGAAFSAADIMMLFPLDVALMLRVADPKDFPAIVAWIARVRERAAYKRMIEKARPKGMVGSLPPLKDEADANAKSS